MNHYQRITTLMFRLAGGYFLLEALYAVVFYNSYGPLFYPEVTYFSPKEWVAWIPHLLGGTMLMYFSKPLGWWFCKDLG